MRLAAIRLIEALTRCLAGNSVVDMKVHADVFIDEHNTMSLLSNDAIETGIQEARPKTGFCGFVVAAKTFEGLGKLFAGRSWY